jgi:asparagine synthase (glutamine-hydrolysing)
MPGIVGILTKMPQEWAKPRLHRMVEALRHESFYETGTQVDESMGAYVGWVARRNSFSDRMPLRNEKGDVVLVFSGEEFPESGTVRRLKERGHVLGPQAASYLVHLYEEDATFPAGLNGRFQGFLTDRSSGAATLFNDRFGLNRIYYHESKEAFYFAAEAKAILAVCPELRSLNVRSLGEFVACGCVLENRTLFHGIYVLPCSAAWVFRDGLIERKGTYFDPKDWEEQGTLDSESFYQELRGVFSRNLPRYFDGQERVGVSLTGGLDTRMIMAWHRSPPGSLPCYTFGGPFRDCEDLRLARQVAQICHQPHETIPVGEDFLSQFARYAERTVYLSDGCVAVYRASDLYVNERAREIAPVRMTGNYGSEVLRWAPAFGPGEPPAGLFRPEFMSHIHAARDTYRIALQGHPVSFAVFRQAPWHHYGLLALEQTQLSLRTPYLDNDFVRTAFRAPNPAFARRDTANTDICLRLIADGDATLRKIRTDRGLGGDDGSISAKASRQLLEFTFRAEYAYDYGMPQWLARLDHLLSPVRPERLFLGRHKFAHYRVWYRDALSKYVEEILLDSRSLSRPYLDRNRVEMVVSGHTKGDRNYTTEIHNLLTLELLHRLFLDTPAKSDLADSQMVAVQAGPA